MRVIPPSSRMRSTLAAMNRSSCSPARTRKSERSSEASRPTSARSEVRRASSRASMVPVLLAVILEIGSHPLPEEHGVVALEEPLAGTVAQCPDALVGLEPIQRAVIRQVQQDHVVEVPAMGDVVPAEELDPVLLPVFLGLSGEQRLHVELEERVAAATDGEVGREHGHGPGNLL